MQAGKNDAADVAQSHAAGKLKPVAKPYTIADGLRGGCCASIAIVRQRHLFILPPCRACPDPRLSLVWFIWAFVGLLGGTQP